MPPANTPDDDPPSQAPRSLTPLSYLSSPAPDLAATLTTTTTTTAADEANTAFLRSSRAYVDQTRDPRLDPSRRERLQRVLSRLNRLHSPARVAGSGSGSEAYGNRTPPRQELYDWAPAEAEEALAREVEVQGDVDVILRELRAGREEGGRSATERMLRYVVERERSGMSEEEERARGSGWFALEGRERERVERVEAFRRGYLAERVPGRLPRVVAPSTAAPPEIRATSLLENAIKYLSDLRECASYEEGLAAAIANNLATKEFFADKHEDFITSLDQIGEEFPQPSSWLQPGATFQGHQHASNASVPITHHQPPAHNPRLVEQINPHYHSSQPQPPPFDASRPWLSHSVPQPPPSLNPKTHPPPPSTDSWPVHVTLHSVDWPTKTLSGTMRAYDVPQHPTTHPPTHSPPKAGNKTTPITTYLEGHILDLTAHTFLTPAPAKPHLTTPENATPYTTHPSTPSFPSATPPADAQNWLALPPFNQHPSPTSSEKMAHTLLSPASLRELNENYIFMRWKERCFVHSPAEYSSCSAPESERSTDRDRGHGLTIGGFYYISLRRCDGEVQGLYFDPGSTPFQLLRMRGVGGGWGAFEVR